MKSIVFCSVLAAWAMIASPRLASAAEPPSAADVALFERLDGDHDGQIATSEVSAEHQRLFARLLRQADANGDKSLSRDEFIVGLVPTRPEKQLEEKQSTSNPQANAIRWLLLSMDTSGNGAIEEAEVPDRLKGAYDSMVRRMDANENGAIERRELYQGSRQLGQIASRYVENQEIDVAAELKKFEQKLGPAAQRFETTPRLDNLGDPEQARQTFAQLDGNGSGQIEKAEFPEQLQRPLERLMRQADRDNDGRLSEREFLAGARQIARRQGRQDARPVRMLESQPAEVKPAEKSMAEESMPADGQ